MRYISVLVFSFLIKPTKKTKISCSRNAPDCGILKNAKEQKWLLVIKRKVIDR
jgi:hypothetical protein